MSLKPLVIDISSLKAGNKSAYEAVYFEFYDVLYHLSLQYLENAHWAQETVQDAFLKLWEIHETLTQETNIRNLLFTIVKNNCLNQLRNKQTAVKHHDMMTYKELQLHAESLSRIGDEVMIADELQERINKAIDRLPENIRQVFVMSRFEELKYAEIAEKLEISHKTVEARMSKALKLLRADLKDYAVLFPFLLHMFNT